MERRLHPLQLQRHARRLLYASLSHCSNTDLRAASTLHDCLSNLDNAAEEICGSLKQMRQRGATRASGEAFRFQMSNVQTWMSVALTNEETCTKGVQGVGGGMAVYARAAEAKNYTSIALALAKRRPRTYNLLIFY
ncbi:unnamed protein product [Linum tenue]|uniref:Pectinesterase inhibitor domain-containing protein n=1 Tax=Linum tenue TaxID=586396 RepID=A0AAV0MHI5_9ROSI|nr:unnamed protein product [Linum tenue]